MRDRASQAETRIMLALLRVHGQNGRATVRDVAEYANRSVGATYRHLCNLARRGLVDRVEGTRGTLRPTVDAFPVQR